MLNLIRRPYIEGYGFSIRKFDKGPHQISRVDKNSPAEYAGLRVNDLLLKINNFDVVESSYAKIGLIIINELEKERLKLEVIDEHLFSGKRCEIYKKPVSMESSLLSDSEETIDLSVKSKILFYLNNHQLLNHDFIS